MNALRWLATGITVTSGIGACVAGFGDWADQALAARAGGFFLLAILGTLATWATVEVFVEIANGGHNG
jgi:hypothetical protein